MPVDNELTIILENLINTLRYSGWKASLDNKDKSYIIAEKNESKIVIQVLKQSSKESVEALKLYAKQLNAVPYVKEISSPSLEKIAI